MFSHDINVLLNAFSFLQAAMAPSSGGNERGMNVRALGVALREHTAVIDALVGHELRAGQRAGRARRAVHGRRAHALQALLLPTP